MLTKVVAMASTVPAPVGRGRGGAQGVSHVRYHGENRNFGVPEIQIPGSQSSSVTDGL